MKTLAAAILYFAFVFGAGFVFGVTRTLWIAPAFGLRSAELIEEPIMFIVIILAARWIVSRFSLSTAGGSLRLGIIALILLLLSEFALVIWMRGMTIRSYLANRDPVAGAVYAIMLIVFAIMPWAMTQMGRRKHK